jgi:sterol desaturase/sphingolipid hydroxylase (fatty acid hydroxylase superfamily)
MDVVIVDNEIAIRLGFFTSLFITLAIAEIKFPRRKLTVSKLQRWGNNLSLSFFNSMLMKVIFPIMGTGLAILVAEEQWGLLNNLQLASWLDIIIYIAVFDFAIYWQHRLFHFVRPLWRLHRMHHTDLDYDLTTGNRFHPLSIALSLLIKLALVVTMGPPVLAVLIAEILLNLTSMFNHSNIHIPARVDRILRLFLVTPDMHSIHHSQDSLEHNKNFGFNFPWWDRLFGTYLDRPALAQESILIGINGFDERSSIWFHKMLLQPFIEANEQRK